MYSAALHRKLDIMDFCLTQVTGGAEIGRAPRLVIDAIMFLSAPPVPFILPASVHILVPIRELPAVLCHPGFPETLMCWHFIWDWSAIWGSRDEIGKRREQVWGEVFRGCSSCDISGPAVWVEEESRVYQQLPGPHLPPIRVVLVEPTSPSLPSSVPRLL